MKESTNIHFKGAGVSGGIAMGRAYQLDRSRVVVDFKPLLTRGQAEEEVALFKDAVEQVAQELYSIKKRVPAELKEKLSIIDAHVMLLRSGLLYQETIDLIRREMINGQWALKRALAKVEELFSSLEDPYIKSRMADVGQVAELILNRLAGRSFESVSQIKERVIIVAHELIPSEAAQLQVEQTLAVITDLGGRTSHSAIMVRGLQIPSVMGLKRITQRVKTGDFIIVDGTSGTVILEPDEETVASYRKLQMAQEKRRTEMIRSASLPAVTLDGHRMSVMANIELLEEVVAVIDHGAEGVGLYRTEFTYLNSESLPHEEDLYREYREVAEIIHPRPIIIRTLDLGGEKVMDVLRPKEQRNPALGLRSIRLSLKFRELFLAQLRAILRAGAGLGNVQLMFPMISGVAELREAKRVFEEAKAGLAEDGVAFDPDMKLGTMIEVPSAAMVADHLALEVDFMNIGTNDLIQYSLAVDRVNEDVAHLYEPLHPGVLKLIHLVVRAAQKSGVKVGVCGEMAGEPEYSPVLLGLGLDFISMNPILVPAVKRIIRSSRFDAARGLLEKLMSFKTAGEVEGHLMGVLTDQYPEDFPRDGTFKNMDRATNG